MNFHGTPAIAAAVLLLLAGAAAAVPVPDEDAPKDHCQDANAAGAWAGACDWGDDDPEPDSAWASLYRYEEGVYAYGGGWVGDWTGPWYTGTMGSAWAGAGAVDVGGAWIWMWVSCHDWDEDPFCEVSFPIASTGAWADGVGEAAHYTYVNCTEWDNGGTVCTYGSSGTNADADTLAAGGAEADAFVACYDADGDDRCNEGNADVDADDQTYVAGSNRVSVDAACYDSGQGREDCGDLLGAEATESDGTGGSQTLGVWLVGHQTAEACASGTHADAGCTSHSLP